MTVREAISEDYGKGKARITSKAMRSIRLEESSEIIEIRKRNSDNGDKIRWIPAKCLECFFHPNDKSINEYTDDNNLLLPICIDEFLRASVNAKIGDMVEVRKVAQPVKVAEHISLMPQQSTPPIEKLEFSKALRDMPIVQDEIVRMNYYGRELKFRVSGAYVLGEHPDPDMLKQGQVSLKIIPTTDPVVVKHGKTAILLDVGPPMIMGYYNCNLVLPNTEARFSKAVELARTADSPVVHLTFELQYQDLKENGEYINVLMKEITKDLVWKHEGSVVDLSYTVTGPYLEIVIEEYQKANDRLEAGRIAADDMTELQKREMLVDLRNTILKRCQEKNM